MFPDFDRIARDLVDAYDPEAMADRSIAIDIAEQLRQVWNARGAADIRDTRVHSRPHGIAQHEGPRSRAPDLGSLTAAELPTMKTITLLVGLLLSALPAAAQSRVYTNADLTSGPVTFTRTVTAEELAGLQARQFQYVTPERPMRGDGPTVTVMPHTPWFPPFAATSEPTRPLSEPWSMTTYVGRGYGHGARGASGGRSHVRTTHTVAPGIHLRYP